MKDPNCGDCVHGKPLAAFDIHICDPDACSLRLFKRQSHPGRVKPTDAEPKKMIAKMKANL